MSTSTEEHCYECGRILYPNHTWYLCGVKFCPLCYTRLTSPNKSYEQEIEGLKIRIAYLESVIEILKPYIKRRRMK